MRTFLTLLVLATALSLTSQALAQDTKKIPVLLDTDIGDDVDDAFALALALSSPELDVRGITTPYGDTHTRALMVCRFLHNVGRPEIPVAAGKPSAAETVWEGQMQYGLRPAHKRPDKDQAAEFLYKRLKAEPGELTLLTVGPLGNIADLLTKYPDCNPWIKRIVLMGGSVRIGYDGKKTPAAEWNIVADKKAAQVVFASGVPLVIAPLDATGHLVLDAGRRARIFRAGAPMSQELHALYQLWGRPDPVLYDPVAVALSFTERFCTMEELHLTVDDKGYTRIGTGKPNARVAMSIKTEEFLDWYVDRLVGAAPAPQAAPVKIKRVNLSKPVAQGNMPTKIHVIEDYETDIERRWWLAGKLETKNVPPGSKRACRGVLTTDFDGSPEVKKEAAPNYTAVIFNPVPGPPMGKNTRLSFRYWLKGADALKVQIYSLSNGYHRHLVLTDLAQEKWQALTVDMTAARRPDGSGGPLAEDERIDDIQFYTDAGAELLIDNIVLYEAAAPEEKRPFPRRPIFTGWFDTGKQGKEWPGTFDIVAKAKPYSWKAASSVTLDDEQSWIRVHLRGPRPLGEQTLLSFKFHLNGADSLQVALVNAKTKTSWTRKLATKTQKEWLATTLEFSRDVRPGATVDEIHFLLPRSAQLLVDDVLLYEP